MGKRNQRPLSDLLCCHIKHAADLEGGFFVVVFWLAGDVG